MKKPIRLLSALRLKQLVIPAFIACITMAAYSPAAAQRSYLRFQTGYSIGALEKSFVAFGIGQYLLGSKYYTSLGQGFNAGGAFGYMFNEHVGVDLGFSYFQGSTQTLETQIPSQSYLRSYAFSAKMLQFAPALVLKAGLDRFDPYMRFGMVMGLGTVTNDYRSTSQDFEFLSSWTYDGGLAWGISSGLGIAYKASEKWSFTAEMTFIGMAYAPKQGEMTSVYINGVNLLDGFPISEREVNFVETSTPIDFFNLEPTDTDQARDAARIDFPMSSFGLNLGLVFKL